MNPSNYPFNQIASALGISIETLSIGLVLLLVWSLVWKGLALWRAGTTRDKVWFVILLLINTAGILDIIYLLISRGKKSNS